MYLLLCGAALYGGLIGWRMLPENLTVLPGSAFDFFKLPISNFYVLVGLGWIELLRQLGLIPLISALLTLGIIWTAGEGGGTRSGRYAVLLLSAAGMLIFFLVLETTLAPISPSWPAVVLVGIFGWLRFGAPGNYSRKRPI